LGMPAPEIEGEDIDGVPFKLSDYHGKVVLLDFWATWCKPCRDLIPHERKLVQRYKNRPFALLGVNNDADRAKLQKAVVQLEVNWRSWFDRGGPLIPGDIAKAWVIEGWPTIYLIDDRGVVRFYQVFDAELDGAVETLVKDAERKS